MSSAALAILNGAISSLQALAGQTQADIAAQQSVLANTESLTAALQSLVAQNTPEVVPVDNVPPTDSVPV